MHRFVPVPLQNCALSRQEMHMGIYEDLIKYPVHPLELIKTGEISRKVMKIYKQAAIIMIKAQIKLLSLPVCSVPI